MKIQPGQLVMLDSFTYHRIYIEPNKTTLVYNIEFEAKSTLSYNPFNINSFLTINYGNLFTQLNFCQANLSENGYIVTNDVSQVTNTFRKLILLVSSGMNTLEQACNVTLTQFNLFTEISKCLTPIAKGVFTYIRKANAFIQQNFQQKINVKQIAEYVGINHSYLQRQYKQYTGQTLLEAIHFLRIQKATSLIVSTNLPVSQIASRVGFNNGKQLSYAFKQLMNVTPSEYKQTAMQSTVDHHHENYDSTHIPNFPKPSFDI